MTAAPRLPLTFAPIYKVVVWGGRRLLSWRQDLPDGPVGESWDLADHDNGRSVVDAGPLAGVTLGDLVARFGAALVGDGFAGGAFPLMVKLIDASARLSVQVHPDDAMARRLQRGQNGKTECWLFLSAGGELFQGTQPHIDRGALERALADKRVGETLNRFEARAGDFYFLPARTVHALGAGCLVYEIQQTSDVTFRLYDWDRLGLDGKPRPMHVAECLETIDFTAGGFGPRRPTWAVDPAGGERRELAECAYFAVEEWRGTHRQVSGRDRCAVVTCLEGQLALATEAGQVALTATRTALVPAAAGDFTIDAPANTRVLVSEPRFAGG